jgi:hypothetical protein
MSGEAWAGEGMMTKDTGQLYLPVARMLWGQSPLTSASSAASSVSQRLGLWGYEGANTFGAD